MTRSYKHAFSRSVPRKQQRGVALFVSLVLLLILTIIGVSAVQTTTLEIRMARNEHDTMLAFQAAESALRDAEQELFVAVANPYMPVADIGNVQNWRVNGVWAVNGASTPAGTPIPGAAEDPRYLIEYAGPVLRPENAFQLDDPYGNGVVDRVEMFQITARGVGGSTNTSVMLQSTFGKILD